MNPTSICTVVFSPTGTSKKVASAIAAGIAQKCGTQKKVSVENDTVDMTAVTTIDLTHAAAPATLPAETVAIFAVPVYGGRVAPAAFERMQGLRGENTPAVLVAVYGNRAFGSALVQLAETVSKRGFVPVAAAAFVGEHSYSTPETPIAEGRPDAQDLAAAMDFGARVRRKLALGALTPVEAKKLSEPHTPLLSKLRFIRFALGFRRRQKRNPVVLLPKCDAVRCTHCGRCVTLCPTQAIARGDEEHTDAARCIRCCACVKGCTFDARRFETPFAAILARNFSQRKPPVTIL
ncbi:4Fe-4S binding protein [uncultured Alistipes sp.]|jgi:hypothetical protein|uniref:4Fe-4S binding protein n=1 Tax=uncultured Alistipes sp. TaxID=538949 RepID=UPI0025F36ACD|nr:4Fe-4S binding protein [uncultured Alistipes sp.]